jgi:uncharacterized protein DUF397
MALNWRKSSHSGGGGGDCVEVAFDTTGPLLRDSKTGDHGRTLQASPTAFAALVDTLKHHDW